MKHCALFLAAGSSQRMDGVVSDKILAEVAGKPLIYHVFEAFRASNILNSAILVYRDEIQRKSIQALWKQVFPSTPLVHTKGGSNRSESVRNGLSLLTNEVEYVYIHDCARPAIRPESLVLLREKLLKVNGAVALAHRVTDTIKQFESEAKEGQGEAKTLDRDRLWAMETPQAFPRALIEKAHAEKPNATDDLALVETMGEPILCLENKFPNPKLTRPSDLIILDALLAAQGQNQTRKTMRIGQGYDIHQLVPGRPLILGGVKIRSEVGLDGHSDADVLLHAISDAILGAAGLPDIGHHFPNTQESIKGISSLKILAKCKSLAESKGYKIANIDSTLIAEKPKVAPYLERMKQNLIHVLNLEPDQIGIKATTNEKLGSLGRAEGIAAHAVALLEKF